MRKIDQKPDEYYKEFSSLLQEYIKYQYEVNLKILEDDLYVEEPKRFFYTLIHKTICSLEAANIFICNFETKRNLHAPLFIILRSILADIITAEYILVTESSDGGRKNLIERIYFDHIENVIFTLDKTYSQMYKWSLEEKETILNSVKLPKFYDEHGKPKIKSITSSPNTLIRKVFSNSNDKNNELLKRAFDLYSIFSKFEHFGELSLKMTHRGYNQLQISRPQKDLDDCICIIITAINNYIHLWDEDLEINHSYNMKVREAILDMYFQ